MELGFQDKIVVVTGGTSGIGESTVKEFYNSGANIIILGQDRERGEEIVKHDDKRIAYFDCDVSKGAEVEKTFEEIAGRYKKLDVLINNAGIQTYGTVTETSEEVWNRTMDVNLKSIFLCSKCAIPLLLRSDKPVIVNVASAQSHVSQEGVAAYTTSKTAVVGLTRSIAIDYAPKLRCVGVSPGAVNTQMLKLNEKGVKEKERKIKETESIHLVNRISEPKEVTNFILFLASDKASFATGQMYRVDGGIGLKIEGT